MQQANEELYKKLVGELDSGRVGTCEYALQVAAEPDIKVTKTAMTKMSLTIGDVQTRSEDSIIIPVKTGKATAVVRPAALKKFARRDGPSGLGTSSNKLFGISDNKSKVPTGAISTYLDNVAPLEMRTQFVLPRSQDDQSRDPNNVDDEDDDPADVQNEERVEKEDLTRSFKYGSTWVPIEDLSEDRLSTQQGLEVVGFSYEDLVSLCINTTDAIELMS